MKEDGYCSISRRPAAEDVGSCFSYLADLSAMHAECFNMWAGSAVSRLKHMDP